MKLLLKKSILHDENKVPIGVLVSYKDWLFIEKLIKEIPNQKSNLSIKNVGGILKKYANPSLIKKEKQAWKSHLKEKY